MNHLAVQSLPSIRPEHRVNAVLLTSSSLVARNNNDDDHRHSGDDNEIHIGTTSGGSGVSTTGKNYDHRIPLKSSSSTTCCSSCSTALLTPSSSSSKQQNNNLILLIITMMGIFISLLPFLILLFNTSLILTILFLMLFQYCYTMFIFNVIGIINQFIDQHSIFITKPPIIDLKMTISIMEEHFKENPKYSSRALIFSNFKSLFLYNCFTLLQFCERVSNIFKNSSEMKWETDFHFTVSILHYLVSFICIYFAFASNYSLNSLNFTREDSFRILFWISLLCQSITILFHSFNYYFFVPYNVLMKNYFVLVQNIPFMNRMVSNSGGAGAGGSKRNEEGGDYSQVVVESQNSQRLFVFEYQSLNYYIVFTLFTAVAYFSPFSQVGLFSYSIQFVIGFCVLILQFWLSRVVPIRKYLTISCVLIVTGLFLLRVFSTNTLFQYFVAFVMMLFVTPLLKFLYKSLPLIIPDQTLLHFAFIWLASLQLLGVFAFFLRSCVYLYFYV